MIIREIENLKWCELTKEEKEELLKCPSYIDGVTGNKASADNKEFIVDLNETYSVAGRMIDNELHIDDDAIIYKPGVM